MRRENAGFVVKMRPRLPVGVRLSASTRSAQREKTRPPEKLNSANALVRAHSAHVVGHGRSLEDVHLIATHYNARTWRRKTGASFTYLLRCLWRPPVLALDLLSSMEYRHRSPPRPPAFQNSIPTP
jgi:hypothetical protein